ncbi:MAG: B12-binding domain-containing radical SAM protein [Methanomassiliicoccales archaeon]|nr:B12-binding domain-containing radical SAM protein [Methanomassiliicoccales archaeon]
MSPPLGIMSIGAYLRQHGMDVRLFDWSGEELDKGRLDSLRSFGPDLVGMTVIIGSSIVRSKKISSWAKALGATVIWGGPFPSVMGEMCLLQAPVDYVVMGEGEQTMLELCQFIQEGRTVGGVRGLAFLRDGKVVKNEPRPRIQDLDALPMPWWEGVAPLEKYLIPFFGRMAIPMVTSRGCPNTCNFCYTKAMWGYRWTSRSAAKVVEEIQLIRGIEPRMSGIVFDDDLFAGDVGRIQEFCSELGRRGVNVLWNCEIRARDIKEPLVGMMKEAGCIELLIGVETGSDRLLSLILKGVSREEIESAFQVAHKAGLRTNAMLIVGLPGEKMEDFHQTEALLRKLNPDGFYFSMFQPAPGTEMFRVAKEQGFKEPSTLEDWATLYGWDVSSYRTRSLSEVPFEDVDRLIHKVQKRARYKAYGQAIRKDPLGAVSRGVRGKVKGG